MQPDGMIGQRYGMAMTRRDRTGTEGSVLLVGLTLLGMNAVRAGHLSITANTIRVTATQPVAFGTLLNDLASGSAETVAFTTNGNDLVAGTDVLSVGGSIQPAVFTDSASAEAMTGQSITISMTGLSGIAAGTPVLPWRWLKAEYDDTHTVQATQSQGTALAATLTGVSISTMGTSLRVFGAIEIEGGDPGGHYSGVITVTANHQ